MDQERAEEVAERVIGDMGGAFVMANGYLGDRLGLFEALADADAVTSEELARRTGLDNVEFVAAPAERVPELSGDGFDLVCTFECVHDMVDPLGTLRAVRESLKDDGVHLWTEPNASHAARENRNVPGRAFHAISPLHCLTVSLAHDGAGLGTVIGERGVRELAEKAGFSRCERVEIDDAFTQLHALRR